VTPEELALAEADLDAVCAEADRFATVFYDVMFELDPSTRALFPDDLAAQRTKLVDELGVLVQAVTQTRDSENLQGFVARGRELGARHTGYGVHRQHYDVMGRALLAALAATLDPWDARRQRVWTTLYRLITDVMCEGAAAELAPGTPR
jgi:hemoglobin-like flavoprotein